MMFRISLQPKANHQIVATIFMEDREQQPKQK